MRVCTRYVGYIGPRHPSRRADSHYQAWSRIVHTLIPNAAVLSKHLTTFARACSATEVVLFERTTFLVIATSTAPHPSAPSPDSMPGTRYEQTSALIKHFKHSLSRVRSEFCSLELDLAEFTAVLDEMTRNPISLYGFLPYTYLG